MESKRDIELISLNILKDSKSYGKFPTSVKNILNYTDLALNNNIDLSKVSSDYFTNNFDILQKALNKVLGLLDFQKKCISVDVSIKNECKKKFIKLHEIGHFVLPWQKKIYGYLDNEKNLSPEANEICEQEANYFASSTLFQMDLFEREANKLPLHISSPILLSKLFGSSIHAALRRYVEYSRNRCALLVIEKYNPLNRSSKIKNRFYSKKLFNEFENDPFSSHLGFDCPFMFHLLGNQRHSEGECMLKINNSLLSFDYQFFNNSYNCFIFMYPKGEINKSNTRIILLNEGKSIF